MSTTHGRDHVQEVELAATQRRHDHAALRCTVWAGHGRVSLHRGARHSDDSSRPDAVGPVHDSRRQGRRLRRLHQHDAGRSVSRRRTAGSDVHARADDGPARRRDRRRSGRSPPAQSDSAVRRTATTSSPASPTTAATTRARSTKALEHVDYDAACARSRRRRARRAGYIGIGVCVYVEICGLGPSQVAGAVGFQGGLWESAIVRFHPSGKVNVFIGASPHGQGEETTFAQIVADELGVDVNDVKVVHGDTDNTPMGWGTYGSRTTAVGGAALAVATRKIKDKAKLLDEPPARSRRRRHRLRRRQVLRQRLARQAQDDSGHRAAWPTSRGTCRRAWRRVSRPRASTTRRTSCIRSARTSPSSKSTPRPAHVDLKRYVAVDDCGPQINPVIVEGQVHGGVVQGIGQALWEEAVYDDNGQLLTGSLADYAIPRADMLPRHRGAVDGHAVAAPSAGRQGHRRGGHDRVDVHGVQRGHRRARAVQVQSIQMPLTPERVWRAMHSRRGRERCTPRTSTITARARSTTRSGCSRAHPGAKLLAGGHSLIPLLKLRLAAPPAVIDIGRVPELRGIATAGDALRIGALTTHAELAASADVASRRRSAGRRRGDRRRSGGAQSRHDRRQRRARRSRVGSADGARRARREPRGRRRRAASARSTPPTSSPASCPPTLADDEILAAIVVPAAARGQGIGLRQVLPPGVALRGGRRGGVVTVAGGTCTACSVAIGGLVSHAQRLPAVESAR